MINEEFYLTERLRIRKEVEKFLKQEQEYLRMSNRKGSDIDYGMGKIRAFERILELLK